MAFKESHELRLSKSIVEQLLNQDLDLVKIHDFISPDSFKEFVHNINQFPKQLALDDGYFFPFPYSTVRKDHGGESDRFLAYQQSLVELSSLNSDVLNELSGKFKQKLETDLGCKPLVLASGKELNTFGLRVLYANKNGIDVHCENAFLNQLDDEFKEALAACVDLENAISIFVTLNAPEKGGRLILFDKEWKDVKINVNETSYEERHDTQGSIFTNRQISQPEIRGHSCNEGEAVVFRAAQIWHGVEEIVGSEDRITLGCFIAKGKDGNIYYWS